jgi:DNA polymerase III delta prime subunit
VKRLEALRASGVRGIAILLTGPPGTGKTAAAHAFARSWLGDGVERHVHPDFQLLTVPEGKKEIPVEQVREARRHLSLRPARGPVRILHVDRAQCLNADGMNTLLKTLEEPPPYAIVLLECERASQLLPTVVSRCRLIRFAPLPAARLEAWLAEHRKLEPARARAVAALAGGSMTRAEALASAWDRLQADRLPAAFPVESKPGREEARWTLTLWGRAAAAALRARAGLAPEQAAPWLAHGELAALAALEEEQLVDLLDRVVRAQEALDRSAPPGLVAAAVGLAARP